MATTGFTSLAENISLVTNSSSVMTPPQASTVQVALSYLLIAMIAVAMLGVGCGVDYRKVLEHFKKPSGILIGFFSQFLFMPLIAFAMAKIFQMTDSQVIILLIVGSCPGGTTSNIVTYWVDGDIDLSITMTFVSSTLGLGMMPLLLFIYSQGFDENLSVPFQTIGITIASLVVPVFIGMFIRHKFPQKYPIILKVLTVFGIISIIAVASASIAVYSGVFVLTTSQTVCAVLFPLIGMGLGYGFSSLVSCYRPLRLHHFQRRTIAIETGVQNAQLATSIVQLSDFPLRVKGAMLPFPIVYLGAQLGWIVVGLLAFRVYKWKFHRITPGDQSSSAEDDKVREEKLKEGSGCGNPNPAYDEIEPPTYEDITEQRHNEITVL
ncbi:ileal sodium/bile acid cotransporter-like [Clavelina lepadiformis]|uniref:ileal sodium/bile acid cotransporter-like n=1 Tax=Clavelina lepadiformis TaxID=159417 RepID=UPI004041A7A8